MKKLNKFFAVLVALAMMATLCVSMAFATPAEQSTDIEKASITKVFDVPNGVATPAAKFYFSINPTKQPGSSALTAKNASISFDANTTGGKQTKVLPLSDLFSLANPDVTAKAFHISQPGEYVFSVTEIAGEAEGEAAALTTEKSYFVKDTDDLSDENVNFNTESKTYNLRLYVINNNGTLEFSAITVEDTTKTGEDADAKKVKPDDQDPTVTDPTTKVGSEFKFTNVYTKKVTDSETNGGAFNVAKTVTGSGDTAFKYPIAVTITIDDATLENGAYTLTGTKSGDWEFASDKLSITKTVNLANNEKDVFTTFPAGAKVKVEEQTGAMTNLQYKDKYDGKVEGLVTGTYADGAKMTSTEAVYTAKNAATVTNNLDDSQIQPEGILISNLPYIALALVAIGGLVAYVVVRRRNADEA